MFFDILASAAIAMANHSLAPQHIVASHEISLDNRYPNTSVNRVFKDNILLTLHFLNKTVKSDVPIDWKKVNEPFTETFILRPGDAFAFDDDVLPTYKNILAVSTHAHFDEREGFLSDGYLVGDGVCHLASLFYWVAKDAGLEAVAPTNHNFATIPEIPAQYGAAIYYAKGEHYINELQNLYIRNTTGSTVTFAITYQNNELKISALE